MLNNVSLVGRAGKDPEIKNLNSGSKVAIVTMACTRPTKERETDWITVKIWGKQAEIAQQYLKKGHLFGINGSIRNEEWESNGEKRSRLVVVANNITLLSPKSSKKDGDTAEDYFGDDSTFVD
jgi:single-strand DNA-binding protein